MPTPREELNQLRARKAIVVSPRQELEQLRALKGVQDDRSIVADTTSLPSVQDRGRIGDSGLAGGVAGGLDQRILEAGAGIIEPAAALASGALAEIPAGLAGIGGIIGARSPEEAPEAGARAVEATREALTFKPRTEAGKEGLRAVGEFIAPVGEALQAAETFLGDETMEATGSPALAAAATTLPTALIEALGFASARGWIRGLRRTRQVAKNRDVKRAVVEAAPDVERIKDVSRGVYKELDDSGVRIKAASINKLVDDIKKTVKKEGFDPDLTPKTAAVLRRLESEAGPKSLTEIDTLRKIAQNAARSIDPPDARLGVMIIDEIDSFLDTVKSADFKKGALKPSEISPKYRVARELWGRSRRSEIVNEAFEKARLQASGFQNGIVVQFRQILSNAKRRRYFKPAELEAMREVVKGTGPQNIAKLVGRLGFSEGQATNIVGGALGATGGAVIFGTPGAIMVPLVGQVSRKLAQKLTSKGAKFADAVIRAGDNADDIARAYLTRVPKAQRTAVELSELLLRPDINLDRAITSSNVLIKEASEIARGTRILASAAALGAPGAAKEIAKEER